MNDLTAQFFTNRKTDIISQDLIGRTLTFESDTGLVGGIIVETEAYMGVNDRAAHSYNGRRTPSTEGLYYPGGSLYIYSQRQYFFLDVATQEQDEPQGVLIRAIEPTIGLEIMQQNRLQADFFNLTNGPGKMMQAFGVTSKKDNLLFLDESPYSIDLTTKKVAKNISATPRIGINMSDNFWAKVPLRFIVTGNPFVSRIKKREIDLENYGWIK